MKKFIFVVLTTLFGCTPVVQQGQKCDLPPPAVKPMDHNVQVKRKLHIDASFTPEELKIISSAADEWTEASGGIIEYELVTGYKFNPSEPPPNKILLLRLKSTDPLVDRLGLEEDITSGTMVIPGTVAIVLIVDRIVGKEAFKTQVMRNLGTDLGLPSYRGKYPGVMNQDMDVACPTKYDMILFCTKYVCDWKETSFCEAPAKSKVDKL